MTQKYRLRLLILALLVAMFAAVHPSAAQPSILAQVLNSRAALVEVVSINENLYRDGKGRTAFNPQTGQLVVLQNIKKSSYSREGAGVVIHPSGVIVTNAHIVHLADFIWIRLHNGQEFPADVAGYIGNLDLAFLKIEYPTDLSAVPLADSDQIQLGDEIMTVGNSFLLNQTVSGGQVIGLGTNRTQRKVGQLRTDLIQTSFNLYEGDSGGPLFDSQGRLIGLMTAKENAADHSSFAVPSNKIKSFLDDYLRSGKLPRK